MTLKLFSFCFLLLLFFITACSNSTTLPKSENKSLPVEAQPSIYVEPHVHDEMQMVNDSFVIDFMYTPRAAGINVSFFLKQLESIVKNETADDFARGDALLMLGRLQDNNTLICESVPFYARINTSNSEENALIDETIGSLNCTPDRSKYLKSAAAEWQKLGNAYRANLLEELSEGKNPALVFDNEALDANTTVITGYYSPILPKLPKTNATAVIIGETTITIDNASTVVSQDDRVYRDWISGQLADPYGPTLLTTFSERLKYNSTELLASVGWHEGGRIKDIEQQVNITHVPVVGTLVARKGNRWFAVDDKGTFSFEVPKDKVLYPTTRFLTDHIAVIIDTHGINMLVEQAIRDNASTVIGCCDHPGKMYAAQYLSDKGISVVCFTDKYTYLTLGHNLSVVGSPPTTFKNGKAILGGRPMQITLNDRIVAVNATVDAYALWYYQTPASYMSALSKAIPLNITYVTLNDFGEMENLTAKAREINATILATRVFNSADYNAVKKWLDTDKSRRVILFHSASYPYGQKIFREYPDRTTFDDPNPRFI